MILVPANDKYFNAGNYWQHGDAFIIQVLFVKIQSFQFTQRSKIAQPPVRRHAGFAQAQSVQLREIRQVAQPVVSDGGARCLELRPGIAGL